MSGGSSMRGGVALPTHALAVAHTPTPTITRSVPSGRVGNSKDALFRSNEHFREAVAERETFDILELEKRLDRHLDKAERARIGVTQLRRFLEQLLQRRYLENVPAIVPLLEREYRSASAKLEATQEELLDLQPDKLKEKGRSFREVFLAKLQLLLKGTVSAPPERFGETLADEHIRGGTRGGGETSSFLDGSTNTCDEKKSTCFNHHMVAQHTTNHHQVHLCCKTARQ